MARDGVDFSLNVGANSTLHGAPVDLNGTYSSRAFAARARTLIAAHPKAEPLYMYIAPQNVHLGCGANKKTQGIQAPYETVKRYPTVVLDAWKVQSAVTTELDYVVGNVTEALQQAGLWQNTLVIFASDNGGPLDHTTNYPLRGGKHTFWDGGVRVVSFISGPVVPVARRGTEYWGLAHSSDWYATLVEGVAGGTIPAHTGVVPPDSVNLWAAIVGDLPSPRTEVVHQVQNAYFTEYAVAIQMGDMKFLRSGREGKIGDDRVMRWPAMGKTAVAYGLTKGLYEKATDGCRVGTAVPKGGENVKCHGSGCLFNVTADPGETVNLLGSLHSTPAYEALAKQLLARVTAVGAAAPPVSRYFQEQNVTHGGDGKGGGYLQVVLDQICTLEAQTGFLEPSQ